MYKFAVGQFPGHKTLNFYISQTTTAKNTAFMANSNLNPFLFIDEYKAIFIKLLHLIN